MRVTPPIDGAGYAIWGAIVVEKPEEGRTGGVVGAVVIRSILHRVIAERVHLCPLAAFGWAAILAFCIWVVYSLGFANRRPNSDIPGTVVRLIGGIALVDATFAAMAGRPDFALAAAAMLPLTRLLQRFVPGT